MKNRVYSKGKSYKCSKYVIMCISQSGQNNSSKDHMTPMYVDVHIGTINVSDGTLCMFVKYPVFAIG